MKAGGCPDPGCHWRLAHPLEAALRGIVDWSAGIPVANGSDGVGLMHGSWEDGRLARAETLNEFRL
jgi:hypothetical protein